MRRILTIVLSILIIMTMCSCHKLAPKNRLDEFNESPSGVTISDLCSNIYSDTALKNIAHFSGTITELNSQYPIECIRCIGSTARVSYCGESKVVCLTYNELGELMQTGCIYILDQPKSAFSVVKPGQTIDDVKKIDPNGNFSFLYTGRNDIPKVSSHCTIDGYFIEITYDDCFNISSIIKQLI